MSRKRMLRADLHTHTHYSHDSILSPRRFVEQCGRRGINCVAVTDHDTIRGAKAVRELADFKVIVGEEVRSSGGEVIGLFLSDEIPGGRTPDETVDRIKGQGGLVGVPHPFDRLRSALRHEDMVRLRDKIDFVEALNARIVFASDNGRAWRFAEANGLAMSAGSDAHSPAEVGRAYVEMPEFDGPQGFLAALRAGQLAGRLSSPLIHMWSRYAVLRRKLGWRPD